MTSSSKPEFVDNRDGNTLATALQTHMEWLHSEFVNPTDLSIATGYFTPDGYSLIADQLGNLQNVRLLLGAEPTPPHLRPPRKPGDPRGERFNADAVNQALRALSEGIARDRDLLGFSGEIDANLQRLIDFLRSDIVEVRRYEKGFLHGKAFVFAEDEGLISGSSNFTGAGLTTNMELNLGRYDPTPVRQVKQWFDDLWEESEAFDPSQSGFDIQKRCSQPPIPLIGIFPSLHIFCQLCHHGVEGFDTVGGSKGKLQLWYQSQPMQCESFFEAFFQAFKGRFIHQGQ